MIFLSLLFVTLAATSSDAREVVVRPGESLSLIAAHELGNIERWSEIAQLNNIADPRRLQAGQRLILPDGDASNADATPDFASALPTMSHLMGIPSLRRVAGAVRYRIGVAAWRDLAGAVRIERDLSIMSANTGRADILVDDISADVGPFTVLGVVDIGADPSKLRLRLELGELTIRSSRSATWVDVRGAHIHVEAAEAKIVVNQTGLVHVTALSGTVELIGLSGERLPLDVGSVATLRPGAAAEISAPSSPLRLVRPLSGQSFVDPNIQFEWQPAPGARGYQFQLTPEAAGQPEVHQDVANTSLEVRSIPDGAYTWRVIPLGTSDASPSPKIRFVIDRNPPTLALSPPALEAGTWILRGHSSPGAQVAAGTSRTTADGSGDFEFNLGALDGLTVIGVEARQRDGGVTSRGAVAVAGRAAQKNVPVSILIPSGRVLINEDPATNELELGDGRNRIGWAWEVDGRRVAGGALDYTVDLTPPEILAIRSTPERVAGGEQVTIFVKARDRGTGLAAPATASISVLGPDSASLNLQAEELSGEGEYVFRFQTPADLQPGYYRVTRLEVADEDGNAIILETRGAVVVTRGSGRHANMLSPGESNPHREFFKDILLIAIGALVSAL